MANDRVTLVTEEVVVVPDAEKARVTLATEEVVAVPDNAKARVTEATMEVVVSPLLTGPTQAIFVQ